MERIGQRIHVLLTHLVIWHVDSMDRCIRPMSTVLVVVFATTGTQGSGLDLTRELARVLFLFKAMIGGFGNNSLRTGSVCRCDQLS